MSFDDQQLIDEFVSESQEHMGDVEADLLEIEGAGADMDTEQVNKVFRAVHSIKGAAGFLGFNVIGELAHALEGVLNLMRNRDLIPTPGIIDVLLRAADRLRGLISDYARSNEADISEHVSALKDIVAGETSPDVRASLERTVPLEYPGRCAFAISEQMIAAQERVGNKLYVLEFNLVADVDAQGKVPLQLVKDMLSLGEVLDARLDDSSWGDLNGELPSEVWFVALIGTVLDLDLVADAFSLSPDRIYPVTVPSQVGDSRVEAEAGGSAGGAVCAGGEAAPVAPQAERLGEGGEVCSKQASGEAVVERKPEETSRSAEAKVRVSVGVLDHLMNLAGELVLARNQLMQMINASRQRDFESVGSRLNQVTSELQEAIMQTRMQPIGTAFNKFPRVVRDLSAKLGKQCELVMEGQEVELDKTIIEAIGDPLTHLVRNAVDHGIETPEKRTASGKNPSATVRLRAFHQAGKVNLTISDDGGGVDPKRVLDKGVSRGMITTEQAAEMSDREAVRLILKPGFSTAEQVTDVSGRGVGMDVVKTNIEKLGGTVEIESQVGVGTTIGIKLPLTLAIIPALIVRCGNERFAIPQVNISELVRIKVEEIRKRVERVKEAEVLRLRGTLLPLVRMSVALGIQGKFHDARSADLKEDHRLNIADRRDVEAEEELSEDIDERRSGGERREEAAGALNIVVVESGAARYGLVVDAVHDSEEIVVKPLGRHIKGIRCLAGATVLGDGHVAMIVDVAGIAQEGQLAVSDEEHDSRQREVATAENADKQAVLLFHNAPNECFAIPMGLIARIERIRGDQIDTVAGQEVLQYRGQSLPLLSLENHINAAPRPEREQLFVVVSHVRNREIGLITPTLVDIRNVVMDLDSVTLREPGVAGSLVVDGKTTRVIDLFELAASAHPDWFSQASTQRSMRTRQSQRVLLAEDSDFFRSQLEAIITGEGYEVVACEDGQVAWQTLQASEESFDLVVTDIEMPEMNGYELTRSIRDDSRFSHLPVIAVTSLAGDQDVQRGLDAGVTEYQVKLDRDKLLKSVTRLIAAHGSQVAAGAEEKQS